MLPAVCVDAALTIVHPVAVSLLWGSYVHMLSLIIDVALFLNAAHVGVHLVSRMLISPHPVSTHCLLVPTLPDLLSPHLVYLPLRHSCFHSCCSGPVPQGPQLYAMTHDVDDAPSLLVTSEILIIFFGALRVSARFALHSAPPP